MDCVRACVNVWASENRDSASFTGRVAFRATVNSKTVDSRWTRPEVCLRLGPKAHLVHYPLRGGSIVNIVAVIEAGWRGGENDHPWDGAADRTGARSGFRPLVDVDAEPHRGRNELASLAAVQPRSDRFLLARLHSAGRRRGAPDGPFPCARRGAGHRGRRRARARSSLKRSSIREAPRRIFPGPCRARDPGPDRSAQTRPHLSSRWSRWRSRATLRCASLGHGGSAPGTTGFTAPDATSSRRRRG